MKNYLKFILLVILSCSALVTQITLAKSEIREIRNNVKCHVKLENGDSIISFWVIAHKNLNQHESSIIGTSVSVEDSLDEFMVIKAHQCVLEEDQFSDKKARKLDENTAR